jgi:histo-blood group ABO system transferase
MKVALCVIATGKYVRFLAELLESAGRFFCAGHELEFHIFVERGAKYPTLHASRRPAARVPRPHDVPHETWPGPTLHRYRTMLRAEADLRACDFIYYVDVDSLFVRPVGEEIFGDLVATIHFGFQDKPRNAWTYEYRTTSRAYVHPREGRRYYAGGFQGGRAATFLEAMRAMAAAIDDDERRGIVAWWHDESHWNRYLIDHPPSVELSHEYCCPQQWRPDTQRIVIVGKDNGEVRS